MDAYREAGALMVEWIEGIWHATFRSVYFWVACVIPAGMIAERVKGLFS
jgi:hypothetical protein